MESQGKIDELVAVVEGARAMPMSASCIVNRGELLGLLQELRELLPAQLRQAQYVLRDRDEVIAEGEREAARLVAEAQAERDRLVTETAVATQARREADRLLAEASRQSAATRAEVDEYVDAKLAHFEVLLAKTLAAVQQGRGRLHEEMTAFAPPGSVQVDEPPLPA